MCDKIEVINLNAKFHAKSNLEKKLTLRKSDFCGTKFKKFSYNRASMSGTGQMKLLATGGYRVLSIRQILDRWVPRNGQTKNFGYR